MAVSENLINRLNDLLMLDHDAVDAYEQAISRINNTYAREKLREFQSDHRRHITDLTECIRDLGGAPQNRRDVKGFFIKGMTAIQSMMSDEMALKAMQTNENLTNSKYRDALNDVSMPEEVADVVRRNYSDEQRHLAWINQALQQRIWEEEQPGAHP